MPTTTPSAWLRDALAGATAAVVSVAIVLTLGIVALAPLGIHAAEVGVVASFACVVLSATVFAVAGRCLVPAGGPSSATALIMATLVSRVVAAQPEAPFDQQLFPVLVCMAAAVTVMGLLQVSMAAFHLGRLVRVVPQPVLAGFMNGIALLILLSQLPALLGVPLAQWHAEGLAAWHAAKPGALLLGLGTAALVWTLARLAPRAPAALLALVAGVVAYHGAALLHPGAALGPTLGSVSAEPTLPGLLLLMGNPARGWDVLQQHGAAIVLTAALLAIIGTLESMLNLRATDHQHGARHDERRELWAMGLANVLGGPFGALPMVQVRSRAEATLQAGGRGPASALGAVAASALMITAGAGWIATLPQAVLAGVMVTIGVSLVDRRSIELWGRLQQAPNRRAVRNSLVIMSLVCVLTVWRGPALGVAAGLLLSTLAFVQGVNRSLVRARRDAVALPSRRVYPADAEQRLQRARRQVVVLELEGALFFGSAERVADEADTLPTDCRFLVLDLRRVSAIDDSAALVLGQLQARLARHRVSLLLAGVGPASARRQELQAFARGADHSTWFQDTDLAVEQAELQLLAESGSTADALGASIPIAQSTLMHGLTPAQQATVQSRLQTRRLQAGEQLFAAGDPGDGLYLLTQGSVSVVSATGQRYVSFSPATMLGELAMLDGQGRSATAVADRDCVVHLLSREALADLAVSDPPLCTLLYRNIAMHLATRLRVASEAWNGAAA